MNQASYTTAIKRRGDALDSLMFPVTPSKIPYGGFSPVRLQTGIQQRPSTFVLYAVKAHILGSYSSFRALTSRTLLLSTPVQRPLTPLRVILSRWITVYYGLIRATQTHLAPYFLRLSSLLRLSRSPILSTTLSHRAISRTPVDRIVAYNCFFTIRESLHHLRRDSASTFSCIRRFFRLRNEAILSSHALRPDGLLARHRHGRLLPSFQLRSHLLKLSNITTRSTVNCRGWTFTNKSCSFMGCKQSSAE
jgi:hypothetical protein